MGGFLPNFKKSWYLGAGSEKEGKNREDVVRTERSSWTSKVTFFKALIFMKEEFYSNCWGSSLNFFVLFDDYWGGGGEVAQFF